MFSPFVIPLPSQSTKLVTVCLPDLQNINTPRFFLVTCIIHFFSVAVWHFKHTLCHCQLLLYMYMSYRLGIRAVGEYGNSMMMMDINEMLSKRSTVRLLYTISWTQRIWHAFASPMLKLQTKCSVRRVCFCTPSPLLPPDVKESVDNYVSLLLCILSFCLHQCVMLSRYIDWQYKMQNTYTEPVSWQSLNTHSLVRYPRERVTMV